MNENHHDSRTNSLAAPPINLTLRQARRFILLKQGLFGAYRYKGKQGVPAFIKNTGCVQYDPVNVCSRSADITLHSRVSGYTKDMLNELLYHDRRLVDYFDKNLSIFPVEDLPVFLDTTLAGGYAEAYDRRGGDAVQKTVPVIRRLIEERGHVCAADVGVDESIVWYWGAMTSLPRAALESMYYRGELIIHHKNGMNKSYAFMKDYVPADILNAALPYQNEEERIAWHVKRRIGAVGMLWNRASDAWLGLGLKAPEREAAFKLLLRRGMILPVSVEGIKEPLFIRQEDEGFINEASSGRAVSARCELLAPLDSFLWDRKLIKTLFGFDYTWEIYTPREKRKFGAYVLPVLYADRLVGRAEIICDRKAKIMHVKNVWYEADIKQTKGLSAALKKSLQRFAALNGCESIGAPFLIP